MIIDNQENRNLEIDIREVLRYLGYKGTVPSEEIMEVIDACIHETKEVSQYRSFYQRYPITLSEEGDTFAIGSMEIHSKDLGKNLKGCGEAYVFGATIGIGVDRLIARAGVRDVMKASIYQSVGAALIEAYCDAINEEIALLAKEEGKTLKPRFSPGYGDFQMEYQRGIFDLLNLSKHTGIGLTHSLLMTPSKSVTAIIGMVCGETADVDNYGEEVSGRIKHDCSRCGMKECPFRR